MNTSSIDSEKRMGLDYKVWLAMFMLSLLSIGIVGYKKITDEPCSPFGIFIKNLNGNNNGNNFVQDAIRLSASNINNKQIIWNFGDDSREETGAIVSHSYSKEGKYSITAKVNDKCAQTIQIYVWKSKIIADTNSISGINTDTQISGPNMLKVNETAVYEGPLEAASYNWTILNRNDYKNQKGKYATYNFKIPGIYTLQLTLNNDRGNRATKVITVSAAS